VAIIAGAVLTTGCITAKKPLNSMSDAYSSALVHDYQPLNPATIWIRDPNAKEIAEEHVTRVDLGAQLFRQALLRDLDCETVRVSLAHATGSASATFGTIGASVKGEGYVLTVDYIKYFAHNKRINVAYTTLGPDGKEIAHKFDGNVPVYEGIGARIRAEFTAREGGVNISGLGALAVAANANRIDGRLTMQTLGVSGPEITALLPIISDISVASIQQAVQSASAIKAKLYQESSIIYPKIVGFEALTAQREAIPAIAEYLYGLERTVVAKQSSDGKMVWIGWEPGDDKDAKDTKTQE
jgi:hypothetical protein